MARYSELKQQIMNKHNHQSADKDNTIHLNINTTSETLSPYAEDGKVVINSEFANFLENSVKDVSVKNDLTFEISSKSTDLKILSKAIKNYYYNEFIDSQRKLKRNLLFCIITFIVGIFALASTMLYQFLDFSILLTGALDIFAWVFIWESFDKFFFERPELKYHQYRQMNFINAKIILSNTKKPS